MTVLALVCGSKSTDIKYGTRTSLVVQGLRFKLPPQAVRFQVRNKDPSCPRVWPKKKKIKHMAHIFDTQC